MDVDGAKLNRIRTERAYSLRELAELAGVTQDNIWKIESGRTRRPHPSTVRKLASALGVAPKDLLRSELEEDEGKAAA
jgi:transcriptional regulator with XRE-family HTH domain